MKRLDPIISFPESEHYFEPLIGFLMDLLIFAAGLAVGIGWDRIAGWFGG